MAYFTFDGLRIFYEVIGNGEPLLLLHGNSVSSNMFRLDIPFYSEFFKVIVIDFPGLGKSERMTKFRDDFWHYNSLACIELLEYLKISTTKIIGTSGGAMTGINLAINAPNIVSKLIADSFSGDSIPVKEAYKIRINRTKAKSELLASSFWEEMHGSDWSTVVDQDLDLLIRVAENNIPIFPGDLGTIKCSVLATASREDELIPDIEERMNEVIDKIPYARAIYFDFGKHPFMITQREKFRELALNFLFD